MSKQPRRAFTPKSKKQPKIAPDASPDSFVNQKPRWKVSRIDYDGEWGVGKIGSHDVLRDILDKLKHFESMTWAEIPIEKHHPIETHRISKDARVRLKEIKMLEFDTLFSFRLTGVNRLWGFRENDAFYILWWDPNHTVYPVEKKFT